MKTSVSSTLLLAILTSTALLLQAGNAQDPPTLSGQKFKITVIESIPFLTNVDDPNDGNPSLESFSGYMIDMIRHVSRPERANFTYELFLPSGYGGNCVPGLSVNDTQGAYSKRYRTQFNCGQDDVNEDRDFAKTDMYWSSYYVTPARQLANQFTIPFQPPQIGALTMYGTATGIKDFADLIEQQKAKKQGPACVGESTAYALYLQSAFPDLETFPTSNDNAGFYEGLENGNCEVIINDYPYATDFIAEQHERGRCKVNGKPVGVIGESLGFGPNQYAVGISKDLPRTVTDTISYWLNVLMTCAPGDPNSACPADGIGGSLYETYVAYERGDPTLCGYVNNPSGGGGLSVGATVGIAIACVVGAFLFAHILHRRRLAAHERRLNEKRRAVAEGRV